MALFITEIGFATSVHPAQRAIERGGYRAFGGQPGRQLRQRAGGTTNGLYKAELIYRRAP